MSGQLPRKRANDRYWNGIFTGIFLGTFFISMIVIVFIRVQGLKVAVNPVQLANIVRAKVQIEAGQDIPKLLEGLKNELPGRIAGHLNGLADLKISFGRSEVILPPEINDSIKMEFNRIIEEAIFNTLNDYDTREYQERIGKNAYEMVLNLFNQEIIGKTYLVKTSHWFTIPVKIVSSAKKNPQIGI